MDVWEFLARSEWPLVVGGAVWLLRGSLRQMFSRVNPTKVDAFGFKAEFERTLDRVDVLVSGDPKSIDTSIAKIEEQANKLAAALRENRDPTIGTLDPKAIILISWQRLEVVFQRVVDYLMPTASPRDKYYRTTKPVLVATEAGLNPNEIEGFLELRHLRNQIVHGHVEVSQEEALRFQRNVDTLIDRLLSTIAEGRP